jgi:hypothetical protein
MTHVLLMPRGCGKNPEWTTKWICMDERMDLDVTQEQRMIELVVGNGVCQQTPVKHRAPLCRTGVIDSALRTTKEAEAGNWLGSRVVRRDEAHFIITRNRPENCRVYIVSLSRGKSAIAMSCGRLLPTLLFFHSIIYSYNDKVAQSLFRLRVLVTSHPIVVSPMISPMPF